MNFEYCFFFYLLLTDAPKITNTWGSSSSKCEPSLWDSVDLRDFLYRANDISEFLASENMETHIYTPLKMIPLLYHLVRNQSYPKNMI